MRCIGASIVRPSTWLVFLAWFVSVWLVERVTRFSQHTGTISTPTCCVFATNQPCSGRTLRIAPIFLTVSRLSPLAFLGHSAIFVSAMSFWSFDVFKNLVHLSPPRWLFFTFCLFALFSIEPLEFLRLPPPGGVSFNSSCWFQGGLQLHPDKLLSSGVYPWDQYNLLASLQCSLIHCFPHVAFCPNSLASFFPASLFSMGNLFCICDGTRPQTIRGCFRSFMFFLRWPSITPWQVAEFGGVPLRWFELCSLCFCFRSLWFLQLQICRRLYGALLSDEFFEFVWHWSRPMAPPGSCCAHWRLNTWLIPMDFSRSSRIPMDPLGCLSASVVLSRL